MYRPIIDRKPVQAYKSVNILPFEIGRQLAEGQQCGPQGEKYTRGDGYPLSLPLGGAASLGASLKKFF